ncbi:MAG: glycine--tRNA ligase subunit beta [SAR86 cluster bacterium]|uniref:Glycine--tRNA ligase beta subunit n=1 Tax=SAR86 cluster bacterium TaxID=2030880 RepID=A0A2A4MSV9_9GAMM|nr:MAG: glycine--tRNA ligase subunit beta [SAR86 cluster bacterium]
MNSSTRDFLVEIGTEELPPKALSLLSNAFKSEVAASLKKADLSFDKIQAFATPRRLALLISTLVDSQGDKSIERFGPAVKAAYDASGEPTKAALGFAKSCGVNLSELSTSDKDGVSKLKFSSTVIGKTTQSLIPEIISSALAKLPIPKRMRWGSSRNEFVRPVHWVLMLYGNEVLNTTVLGIKSGSVSYGHRFHYNQEINLAAPSEYEASLESPGFVIADFDKRKAIIKDLVTQQGQAINARAVIDDDLLNEVTGLVEHPVALMGKFDKEFLEVPPEALISAMKSHQKYFYLVDENKQLLPYFITVSNIASTDPKQVIEGNEKVIRPRLADSRFFFETDKKQSLESRLDKLKTIVFQQQLGSVYDKCARVSRLGAAIADKIGIDASHCERSGLLSKTDLVTNMVGEFADLQGLMGCYYAINDGEPSEVAIAIKEQYLPKFSGDKLPESTTGCVLAIADKLDTVCGLFAIGQLPTGSKDPFALRRSAIGILRIMVEKQLDLDLMECINSAAKGFEHLETQAGFEQKVFDFLLDRLRAWYLDENISNEVFQSVFALKPSNPLDFHIRIQAVHRFHQLEVSKSLASSNKRVANILSKCDVPTSQLNVDESLFQQVQENNLCAAIASIKLDVAPLFEERKFNEALELLAQLKPVIDEFFEAVLVMAEDDSIKNNRLALLHSLRGLFLQVADISYLQKA